MSYMTSVTSRGSQLVGAAVFALWLAASGHAVAQTPETLAAADRLIAVQKPAELMQEMAANIVTKIPGATEAQKQAFVAEMTDPAFMTRYQAEMRVAFAKHLTAEEMDALADFYSKPVAQSAMKKMGITTAELMTFMQREIPAMIARITKTP
jgi:hypothetical protein